MRKAIIIDDESKLANDYAKVLSSVGYDCDVATSGEAALVFLKKSYYDVAVIDQDLGTMKGEEIVREIRHRGLRTVVIFVSGVIIKSDGYRIVRNGANHYIDKPVDPDELKSYALGLDCTTNGKGPVYTYRTITMYPADRKLYVRGEEVELKGLRFDFLAYLMARIGQYVPTHILLREVCPGAKSLESSAARVQKREINKTLASKGERDVIRSTQGKGYAILKDTTRQGDL